MKIFCLFLCQHRLSETRYYYGQLHIFAEITQIDDTWCMTLLLSVTYTGYPVMFTGNVGQFQYPGTIFSHK